MQISIFKTFGTIRSLHLLQLLLATLLTVTIVSEYTSFNKLNNLKNEKELATAVYKLGRDDLDLANIQFRGKNTILRHENNALKSIYAYDLINKYTNTGNYQHELSKLQKTINDFNIAAGAWYTQENTSQEELKKREEQFTETYNTLITQINALISQNVLFEEKRFAIQIVLISALLLLIMLSTLWSTRRLKQIRGDIKVLTMSEHDEMAEFYTSEAEAVSKNMGRAPKITATKNPAYLDSVTGINSYKGFLHEYGEKKNQKLGNYTAVCIFAVDKLNELEMQYSQDFTEALIKKVGFMLSLYRQHNDIIGRMDHNQFAILLSRNDKTSAINDCELIRKSVEEAPFKTADGQNHKVTLSGGFVQKMSTQNLDEILAKANKVLSMSIQHGGNRIAQLRDKSTALK